MRRLENPSAIVVSPFDKLTAVAKLTRRESVRWWSVASLLEAADKTGNSGANPGRPRRCNRVC